MNVADQRLILALKSARTIVEAHSNLVLPLSEQLAASGVLQIIDNALALAQPVDCWFCDGKREWNGEPCLICVDPLP